MSKYTSGGSECFQTNSEFKIEIIKKKSRINKQLIKQKELD